MLGGVTCTDLLKTLFFQLSPVLQPVSQPYLTIIAALLTEGLREGGSVVSDQEWISCSLE